MRIYMVLIGLVVCGCVSQPTELTQKESDLDVYYEEPDRNYEDLGPIIAWSQYDQEQKAKKKILSGAVELGADGVIIRFSGNKVGDRSNLAMYQIEATALRFLN